jgi:hypothetical protein
VRLDGDPLETHYCHILSKLGKTKGTLGIRGNRLQKYGESSWRSASSLPAFRLSGRK